MKTDSNFRINRLNRNTGMDVYQGILFEIVLAANSKADTLIQQSKRFRPGVVISDRGSDECERDYLRRFFTREDVTRAINESDADIVLTAMVISAD